MKQITHEFLVENGLILFETIVGSQAYGTQTPTSDIDKKFVYILPQDYILGTGYVEQINVNKDYVGWEIRRFLELMASNNPTVLELLNSPEDCIVSKHPLFDDILAHKDDFITKICKDSFGGYARQQIKKARGLDKKQNWDKDKVTRKDVLDFVYVIDGGTSVPFKVWVEKTPFEIKFFGVVNVPNAKDLYALYYDWDAHNCFSENISEEEKEKYKETLTQLGKPFGLGYKGLVKVGTDGENLD
jgi:predicted nucleotidyltransferase